MTKAKASPGTPEDPTDHSKSASAIADQTDPKGKSGAAANAASMDAVNKKDEDKKEAKKAGESNTIADKIIASGLFFVRDHSTGEDYVGISPQNNPDANTASKLRSAVTPLGTVAPRTGMIIRPKSGDAFTIGEGFGPDSQPGDWAKVTSPDGKALFS